MNDAPIPVRPEFVDNRAGNTLLAALQASLPNATILGATILGGMAEVGLAPSDICIATAFITLSGLGLLADRLAQAPHVRILVGAEPEPEARTVPRRPGDPTRAALDRQAIQRGLTDLDAGLRRARDTMPFTMEAHATLGRMASLLRSGRLESRRFEKGFLHAKAYLMDGLQPGFYAGSSNLTRAGLTASMELNVGNWDPAVFPRARDWFDALWHDAAPLDLAALFAAPLHLVSPRQVFLRVLWQLYGDEIAAPNAEEVASLGTLTAFQQLGAWRARRIIAEFGGALVADEVGLGKTYIAGEIMNGYAERRQRVLLVCPAVLRDTTWKQFRTDTGLSGFVECLSYDQLGVDLQPDADGLKHIARPLDEYPLVVVDEAHNYRNPAAPHRGAALARLLGGRRRDVLLLTATPVNNSLWDLYHLLRLLVRPDTALASRGVVSMRERFKEAAAIDPAALSPDLLFPVIDAVTVKRTRAFMRKYYANETIVGRDGSRSVIVFPQAVALSIRYDLDAALFQAVADALDPGEDSADRPGLLAFARYAPDAYLRDGDPETRAEAPAASGLLRSGLLKRFESSAHAFRRSVERMLAEHERFLGKLAAGQVLTVAELREVDDGIDIEDGAGADAAGYDVPALRTAVERDRAILTALAHHLAGVDQAADPKLEAVVAALRAIVTEAEGSPSADERRRNRKVLVFSSYADTVVWLLQALQDRLANDPVLAPFAGRIAAVAGGGTGTGLLSRDDAVFGFAPETASPHGDVPDRYDLLLATDVLAEGLNLQQCRHIVNYDLPWNPMRLVQRHGRIDRIGSVHPRVFLRTVFPAGQLDALLRLEARILRKLAQAAHTIGVGTAPLEDLAATEQVFAETHAEIERLAQGDPSLYERGGTPAGAQTGEEYRQQLRAALEADREGIIGLPGQAGSGLRRGSRSGVFFCAEIQASDRTRTFLRFVPATEDWQPDDSRAIVHEVGTCLRLIECTCADTLQMPPGLGNRVFDFWQAALIHIMAEWQRLSDPASLQPPVRRLNKRVAAFIRANQSLDLAPDQVGRALDILEAPWLRRDEALLREQWERKEGGCTERARGLAAWVLGTGLEPYAGVSPLPDAVPDDVRLVCWMAIDKGPVTRA